MVQGGKVVDAEERYMEFTVITNPDPGSMLMKVGQACMPPYYWKPYPFHTYVRTAHDLHYSRSSRS